MGKHPQSCGSCGNQRQIYPSIHPKTDLRENPILGPGAPSGPVSGPWSVVRGSRPLQTCGPPQAEAPPVSNFAGRVAHGSHGHGLTWRQHSVHGLLGSWVRLRGHHAGSIWPCREWPVFRTRAADRGSLRCRLRLGWGCLMNRSRRYSSGSVWIRYHRCRR